MAERTYGYEKIPEKPELCIKRVTPHKFSSSHQCTRKRGHGPEGELCKQHAQSLIRQQEGPPPTWWESTIEVQNKEINRLSTDLADRDKQIAELEELQKYYSIDVAEELRREFYWEGGEGNYYCYSCTEKQGLINEAITTESHPLDPAHKCVICGFQLKYWAKKGPSDGK